MSGPLPLQDVRVLAIEQYGAGPFGSVHLADLGAEIIKIEDPRSGGDVGAAETAESDGTGVVVVSGRTVDVAVVRHARRVLALTERDETPSQSGV